MTLPVVPLGARAAGRQSITPKWYQSKLLVWLLPRSPTWRNVTTARNCARAEFLRGVSVYAFLVSVVFVINKTVPKKPNAS